MESKTEESRAFARRRSIRLIAAFFIGALIVFTLLGNTLQGLMMPKVATALANAGELTHSFQGGGVLKPREEQQLVNPAGWKASKVLIKAGDQVKKGQTLIEYDDSDAKQQLDDEQAALKKLQLSMDALHAGYITAVQNGDPAAQQAAKTAIDSADIDISLQKQHVEALQADIAKNRKLAAPFAGIVTAVNAAEGQPPSGLPDVVLADVSTGYKFTVPVPSGIADALALGETLDVQVSGKDGEIQALQGTVADLAAQDGSTGAPGGSLGEDSPGNGGVGGEASGGASGEGIAGGNGTATSSTLLRVFLQSDVVHAGEQARISIAKSKTGSGVLIPLAAVHYEDTGPYVYSLEEKQGPLGNAYYIVRTAVKIADTNDSSALVSEGLFEGQPVVTDSSGLISDGSRVRM